MTLNTGRNLHAGSGKLQLTRKTCLPQQAATQDYHHEACLQSSGQQVQEDCASTAKRLALYIIWSQTSSYVRTLLLQFYVCPFKQSLLVIFSRVRY
jgi:hypothetical protein